MKTRLTREEIAAIEIGRTSISPMLARVVACCFVLVIVLVPVMQAGLDISRSGTWSMVASLRGIIHLGQASLEKNHSVFLTLWQKNNSLLANMNGFEKNLEETSFLRNLLLSPGQQLLLQLGYGNEKVYPGLENWLFYRPDMDYLMGPGFLDQERLKQRSGSGKVWEEQVYPDPLPAILDFHEQLAKRDISLILMPTPIKASVHPEKFAQASWHLPLQNRSWAEFIQRLEKAGITVFDPSPLLVANRSRKESPVYLQTDTHWRPEAMEKVARELAAITRQKVSLQGNKVPFKRKEKTGTNRGDIDAMLMMPESMNLFKKEQVTLRPVITAENEVWQPDPAAEVLLLGDSFSNIYSLAGMGWGEGAGLGEQLSYYLDSPVDFLLQNDAGSHATREMLASELARGRDRLAGKKVVIWEFADRELASGNWKKITMVLRDKIESDFYVPLAGEQQKVRGTVAAISKSPLPGTVPYRDNVITLHLVDIRNRETGDEYGQALVYAWGMRNNVLSPLARARVGEQIDIKLTDWDTVQVEYSSYRRSTLDDEMLELELPVWGEIIP